MSGPVFVRDAEGRPLMPIAAAYARKLLRQGKARWVPHHAFSVIQLSQAKASPTLRPVVVTLHVQVHTAALTLVATGEQRVFPLLRVLVDLRTDLSWRLRRRTEHRRRRRARGRYRSVQHDGLPFKLRRPSRFHDRRYRASLALQQSRYSHHIHSPLMHWRAQAIRRTVQALMQFVPISHVAFVSLPAPYTSGLYTRTSLRERLLARYGVQQPDGRVMPACAYCGTTEGSIHVEHIVPRSRGGTDSWNNRVLACARCNAAKGNRTPAEAGMPLRIATRETPGKVNRSGAYQRYTTQLLKHWVRDTGFVLLQSAEQADDATIQASITTDSSTDALQEFVAKPIARPVKQRFTARNYSLRTPLREGMQQVGTTIKRQVRVNQALHLNTHHRRKIGIIRVGDPLPEPTHMLIRLGMLCEGRRSGQSVRGIVSAIQSRGNLTLLVLHRTDPVEGVQWKRISVSPRLHCRVLSTEKVVFIPTIMPEGAHTP